MSINKINLLFNKSVVTMAFTSSTPITYPWRHPFNAILSGSSGTGKSYFTERFCKHVDLMVDTPIKEILWCFSEIGSVKNKTPVDPRITYHQGIPIVEELPPIDGARLLIIDDMMTSAVEEVVQLFTKKAHHNNISVIYITQNLFYRHQRDISVNAHYIVCMASPRTTQQIATLASQIFPKSSAYVLDAYRDATRDAYSYILLDLNPNTPEQHRLRTNIFPDDGPYPTVYIPIERAKKRK
jgi:hypothetical protein